MAKQSFLIIRGYAADQTQDVYTGEGKICQWEARLGKKPSHPVYSVTELEFIQDKDMPKLQIYQGYFSRSPRTEKYREITSLCQLNIELNDITISLLQRILQEAQSQQAQGR